MEKTTADVLGFRRHLRPEIQPGGGVFLFGEEGVTVLRGAGVAAVATLLDGTRDRETVLRDRPPGMSSAQVTDLLTRLQEAGLIVTRHGPDHPQLVAQELGYWDACGVDTGQVANRTRTARIGLLTVGTVDPRPVREAMRSAGLTVCVGAPAQHTDLSVVLCSDYLDPRLATVEAAQHAAGRPWMLAKPTGMQIWLGPVLEPGNTACWHCLAHRLRGNRRAEACVQAVLGHRGPAACPPCSVPPQAFTAAHLLTLEITKWLVGYRYAAQQAVRTVDTSGHGDRLHELRRRPQCPSCGDPSLVATRTAAPVTLGASRKAVRGGGGHRTRTASQTLERYGHLVSPITGIVKEIVPDPRVPPFVNAYLSGPNLAVDGDGLAGLRAGVRAQSGGKGATPIDAQVGALCEAVERYSAQYQGDELRVRDSYAALGADAVHPRSSLLFAGWQYADRDRWNRAHGAFQYVPRPFDESVALDWTPLWSLTEGRRRLLPTGMLYLDAPPEVGGMAGLVADTNGNAAGSCREDAILQGLLELIERDAAAIWWYNRTPLPGMDMLGIGEPWIEEMCDQYKEIGRELWALDLTTDLGVPVMVALSRRPGPGPEKVLLGFGAHLDPRIALRRAVSELNQLLPVVLDSGYEVDDPDARRWLAHATVASESYLLPQQGVRPRTRADFAFDCSAQVRDDVAGLVATLRRHDLEVLVLDQTRPDIELPVVKVVVPGLRHFWARFAPGRLFDVPVRLGRLTEPTPVRDLNPCPLFL